MLQPDGMKRRVLRLGRYQSAAQLNEAPWWQPCEDERGHGTVPGGQRLASLGDTHISSAEA